MESGDEARDVAGVGQETLRRRRHQEERREEDHPARLAADDGGDEQQQATQVDGDGAKVMGPEGIGDAEDSHTCAPNWTAMATRAT